jgi:mannose-6-phosphate isomerase
LSKSRQLLFFAEAMSSLSLTQPLTFDPIFMERVWGGRKLADHYGKELPAGLPIGESWEIVDRPEAQSVVRKGPLRGRTLHELWNGDRRDIFGEVADAPRFPLLIKLLDAHEKLSIQVHPPNELARELHGEAKSEFWYIADAAPDAELYVGVRGGSTRQDFEQALRDGDVAQHVHRLPVKTGDAIFLPSGRVHAIGAGNLIVEIQQNSDTTYRVFDWNRLGTDGKPRKLHIEESLRCIDFADYDPALIQVEGEILVRNPHFQVEKWKLDLQRPAVSDGKFAIVFCLKGEIRCGDLMAKPGQFFLVPGSLGNHVLQSPSRRSELLRITIP